MDPQRELSSPDAPGKERLESLNITMHCGIPMQASTMTPPPISPPMRSRSTSKPVTMRLDSRWSTGSLRLIGLGRMWCSMPLSCGSIRLRCLFLIILYHVRSIHLAFQSVHTLEKCKGDFFRNGKKMPHTMMNQEIARDYSRRRRASTFSSKAPVHWAKKSLLSSTCLRNPVA